MKEKTLINILVFVCVAFWVAITLMLTISGVGSLKAWFLIGTPILALCSLRAYLLISAIRLSRKHPIGRA